MKVKYVNLNKNSFIRNVFIMVTGAAAAQAVVLILSPIITRLYGPEAFGLLGVFTAIVGIVSPIAALAYPIAIVLPKNDNEAKGLVRLSLYVSFLITIVIILILLLFHKPLVRLFQLEEISSFLILIPLVILFSGFLQVVEQWLIRTKQFRVTAKVSFLHALIIHGGKVVIGLFYPIAAVLVIFTVLGQALRALMMIGFAKDSAFKNIEKIENQVPFIRELAKRYKEFPLFRAPEVFINAVSQSLPILLLTSFFGPVSAGFYSICMSVLNLPLQLIGKSVGDVFYPRISEAANNGENLSNLIKKATFALALVGFIPFGIVIAFGPGLFSLVFGSEWSMAGEYARWIALWTYFGFLNRPSVNSLPVLSAQAFHLRFTIFVLITRVAVLAIGYFYFGSDLAAIAFYGVSGAILNIILIIITIYKSKKFYSIR